MGYIMNLELFLSILIWFEFGIYRVFFVSNLKCIHPVFAMLLPFKYMLVPHYSIGWSAAKLFGGCIFIKYHQNSWQVLVVQADTLPAKNWIFSISGIFGIFVVHLRCFCCSKYISYKDILFLRAKSQLTAKWTAKFKNYDFVFFSLLDSV